MSEIPPSPATRPSYGFGADDSPGDLPLASPPAERWSKTAVTGFVLSLIGCLGITAALGFVFGIFGLMATRDGRLRGRGLAIAALPISILTGAIFVCLLLLLAMGRDFGLMTRRLAIVLTSESARTDEALAQFRLSCSEEFNEVVSKDGLGAWFDQVQAKHGTLVEFGAPVPSDKPMVFQLEAKFSGGVAKIEMFCVLEGRHMPLDDIQIDGSSPRQRD